MVFRIDQLLHKLRSDDNECLNLVKLQGQKNYREKLILQITQFHPRCNKSNYSYLVQFKFKKQREDLMLYIPVTAFRPLIFIKILNINMQDLSCQQYNYQVQNQHV